MRLRGVDYTLPSAQGGASTVLTNNGSGVLSWTTPAGGLSSDADFNTKGGTNAGLNLVSGAQYNTFLGYEAGRSASSGGTNAADNNTAVGYRSMMNNTSGFHNTANGYNSLYSNTSGAYNVAIGHDSLYSNISGYSNVALGMSALNNNTTGGSNVAIGPSALHSNITGDSNVAVGNWAGTESSLGPNTTSSNSVYVGNGTRALFSGGFNEIVIGSNTTGNGSNTTTIGTGNVLYVGGSSISGKVARFTNSAGYCDVDPLNASLVCSSDITLKKNITTLEDIEYILNEQIDIPSSNLEKLLTLTPVKYNWNSETDDTSKHTGFIAQEVEQLFPELVSTDENTEFKSISYSGFTPYIVNAIKELNLKVEAISLDDNDSNIFSSIIKKVENGIAYLTGLVVDTIVVGSQEKRTGITLYDEETGDPYCISVINGEIVNKTGECGVVEMPDICPNIDEYQQEIPGGYELNENNECIEVYIEEKSIDSELENVDICSNIEGIQIDIPDGYKLDENNECIKQGLEIPVDPSPLSTATPGQE